MVIKKSKLDPSLWASCDSLRVGISANQYKDYVLTMQFISSIFCRYEDNSFDMTTVLELKIVKTFTKGVCIWPI